MDPDGQGITHGSSVDIAISSAALSTNAHDLSPYSGVTPDGQGITHGSSVDIAMAVTIADGGLITPILKVSTEDNAADMLYK